MTRFLLAAAIAVLVLACNRSPESVPKADVQATPATVSEADVAIPLLPTADAKEQRSGVYVATVFQRPNPGLPVEEMKEIFFIETVYDDQGKEVATSVPSSRWSLLSEESRATIAGMRSGERRRVWRCPAGPTNPCRVEDVQVFDGAEARAP